MEVNHLFLPSLVENFIGEILVFFRKQFLTACPSGRMGRKDFFKFYRSLRVESEEKVKEIANFVFTAFDRDSNGKIDFTEFLCKFIMCISLSIFFLFIRWLCDYFIGNNATKIRICIRHLRSREEKFHQSKRYDQNNQCYV